MRVLSADMDRVTSEASGRPRFPGCLGWLLAVCALTVCAPAGAGNPWSKVKDPAPGPARVLGKYTAGCIIGAQALAPSEPGLRTMRLKRRRYFGHPRLVGYLRALGRHMVASGHGTVLVGDLSMPRGGPTLTNHVSHQSGLDADIWFRMLPDGAALSMADREIWSAPSFVNWGKRKLKPSWGEAQSELIRYTAKRPEVQRIFVNPVIKAHLCEQTTGKRDWLAKVRPWYGHADHLHVRLYCPRSDPLCVTQQAVPAGDGCGEELSGWLKPRKPSKKKKSKPTARRMPQLPAECRAVLK